MANSELPVGIISYHLTGTALGEHETVTVGMVDIRHQEPESCTRQGEENRIHVIRVLEGIQSVHYRRALMRCDQGWVSSSCQGQRSKYELHASRIQQHVQKRGEIRALLGGQFGQSFPEKAKSHDVSLGVNQTPSGISRA